jgi:uncharacterized protein (DUF2147 family)
MKTVFILVFNLILCFSMAQSGNPPDISGKWLTPEGISIIGIERIHGQYRGSINMIHPKAMVNGDSPTDSMNSNRELRDRKLQGLTILTGFTYDKKKGKWYIDKMYDPEKGKYFEGSVSLKNANELVVRGHVPGKKWLGKTEIWRRVDKTYTFE